MSWVVPQEWFPSLQYLGPKISHSHSTCLFTWRPSLEPQLSAHDGAQEGRGGQGPAPTWPPTGRLTPGQSLRLFRARFFIYNKQELAQRDQRPFLNVTSTAPGRTASFLPQPGPPSGSGSFEDVWGGGETPQNPLHSFSETHSPLLGTQKYLLR